MDRQLTDAQIARPGEVVIPDHGGYLVMVLEDGETFSDLEGARIVRFADPDVDTEDVETALRDNTAEVVATFTVAS